MEYGFGWAAWERTVDGMSVRVTAFVPEDANARVLLIECAGRARITWHTDLVCAGRDADAPAVVTAYSGGVFTAGNARADTPLHVCAAAGMPLTGWTCDRFSFLRGQMDRRAGAGLSPCFALEGVVERQGVLVCGCDTRANLLRLTQPDEAVRALRAEFFTDTVPIAVGEKQGIRRKPAPDTLLAAMEKLGADPDKTVFVGDSEVDIATARAANLPCISVLWGFRDRDVLEQAGAQHFAADIAQLQALLG